MMNLDKNKFLIRFVKIDANFLDKIKSIRRKFDQFSEVLHVFSVASFRSLYKTCMYNSLEHLHSVTKAMPVVMFIPFIHITFHDVDDDKAVDTVRQ